jgi:hypothetical protein
MPEKYLRPHTHERLQAVERMKRDWAAQRQSLATVRRFNAANGKAWFWPKIAAALVSKHHWLIVACDARGTVVDLDLRVKPRDPEAFLPAMLFAAASNALAGRLTEAKKAMSRASEIDPTLQVSVIKDWTPLRRAGDLARFEDGLRKAGLPG